MKLVPNWRQCWRWQSTWFLSALAVLPVVWMELPPDAKDYVPEPFRPYIVAGLAISGLIGRIRHQRGPE